MMTPAWTLESLAYHWGDAFLFSYARDRWVALRRDQRSFLTAGTLDELEAAIRADYGRNPVPRDCDPPDATDYLQAPDSGGWWGEGNEEWDGDNCRIYEPAVPEPPGTSDDGAILDPETALILAELKTLFPSWEVTYSAELGTWTAKSQYGSFCEPTIALVWVALARMEQRRREESGN